ncbi:MAG: F0F1 ATP synthase subunit A [Kordiimonadaceae bacterium]|nr:F0F1 ATP synthase subunit A [Kordiimonadaceae bacterium]
MASPLEQFTVKTWGAPLEIAGYDVSFTNSAAAMVATFIVIALFVTMGMRKRALVPGRWQTSVEMCYEFIAKMLGDAAGPEGRKYFPFVFSLFMFVLAANLIGMVPWIHAFTFTSHIAVTFAMAFFVFIGVTIIGFMTHGLKFFGFFVPEGAPWYLLLILVPIEIISYLSRPISLSVRLFANMVAGHTMLKVFGGFVVSLGALGGIFAASAFLPFAFIVALTGLELLVACLQAYVFAMLTCLYLNDALHMH